MKNKRFLGIVVLLALAGLYFFTPIRDAFTLESVVRLVERIKNNPWVPVLFTATYIASCVLWPLTIFPVAGGVLFGFWKGFLLNTLAANVGAWITFFIARQFGREVVGKFMKGSLKTFDERATRHGLWAVFAFRMLGFPPFLVTNYGAGLSGVRVRDYVLGTFLGMLMWTAVFTYFADTLWEALTTAGAQGFQEAAGRFFWPVVGGLALLAGVVGAAVLLKRRGARAAAVLPLVFAASSPVFSVDHSAFDRLLRAYAKDGKVNYQGFRKESQTLQQYLKQLSYGFEHLAAPGFDKAFWINAYNACVIKGVLDHYPLKSVMEVRGFFNKTPYEVAGETLTLDAIEKKSHAFGDPRTHFAVVCASKGCPPLRSEAYAGDKLDQQLAHQAATFLADRERGLQWDEAGGVIRLCKIFKWARRDFVKTEEGIPLFGGSEDKILSALLPYMDKAAREKVNSRRWRIDYLSYDWTLNDGRTP